MPGGIRRRKAGHCFANAFALVARHSYLRYVEGFALGPLAMAIHHAWCADGDDRVIDPTWDLMGLAYFGIVVEPATLTAWANARSTFPGPLDWYVAEVVRTDARRGRARTAPRGDSANRRHRHGGKPYEGE